MVEVNPGGGTALMTPEEIQRERERRDAMARFADQQRFEQQKSMWHTFSYTLPVAAFILGACFLGVCFFAAFKIMGDFWLETKWF